MNTTTNQLVPLGEAVKVSTCRDLILLSDMTHTLEFAAEHQQVARINEAMLAKHEQLSQMQARIHSMNVFMLTFFPDLHKEIRALEDQKLALVNPQSAELKKQYDEQSEKDQVQAEIDLKNKLAELKEAQKKAERAKSPSNTEKVKRLYGRISRKCHPDRTRDKVLHDLFQLGKQFYDENDLGGMKQLWKSIAVYLKAQRRPDWLREHMKMRKQNLMTELTNISVRLAEEKNSVGWQYVQMIARGEMAVAKSGYQGLMIQRINNLQAEIRHIAAEQERLRQEEELKRMNPYRSLIRTTFYTNR